jgi:hypothetical protein
MSVAPSFGSQRPRTCTSGGAHTLSISDFNGALGGTRTPNLLIRRGFIAVMRGIGTVAAVRLISANAVTA